MGVGNDNVSVHLFILPRNHGGVNLLRIKYYSAICNPARKQVFLNLVPLTGGIICAVLLFSIVFAIRGYVTSRLLNGKMMMNSST